MALLVLVSTVSFAVEKHYCGDYLMAVSVFSTTEACGMAVVDDMVSTSVEKNNCCKNETEVVKGQDELKFRDFEDFTTFQQLFITSYVYSYINLFEGLQQVTPHKNYSPPNLIADIQVLDQVFLI